MRVLQVVLHVRVCNLCACVLRVRVCEHKHETIDIGVMHDPAS